jgi:excinuclease UvrABC nuclease subunit
MEILDDKIRVWLASAKFVKAIPGIYVLYNRNKETIYIGESENLQQTFTKYVRVCRKSKRTKKNTFRGF